MMKSFLQWLENFESQHISGDPKLSCPDCEINIGGLWRTGICDDCGGSGRNEKDEGCSNCQGTGHPICCRCEGTGIDLNMDGLEV